MDTPSAQGPTVSTLDKPLRLLSKINERKNKKNIVGVPEALNSSISYRKDYSWKLMLAAGRLLQDLFKFVRILSTVPNC